MHRETYRGDQLSELPAGDCGVCVGWFDHEALCDATAEIITSEYWQKCCECNKTIPGGEQFERFTGDWDDDGIEYSYVTCMICVEIRTAFCCKGWVFENLWEAIKGEDGGGGLFPVMTTGCLVRLQTPAAKAYLLKRWQEWKGLEAAAL